MKLLTRLGLLLVMFGLLAGAMILPQFVQQDPSTAEETTTEAEVDQSADELIIAESAPEPAAAPAPDPEPEPVVQETVATTISAPAPEPAPTPEVLEESPAPASEPEPTPRGEPVPMPDVDPFFAAVDSGDLDAARAFLADADEIPASVLTSLERTLSMAEKRQAELEESNKALAQTRMEVASLQKTGVDQIQKSLSELEEAAKAAKAAAQEAASLREELAEAKKTAATDPSAAPTPKPAAPAPSEPLPEAVPVTFGFDSSRLSEEEVTSIKTVAETLKTRSDLNVELRGFSDRWGPSEYNATLSAARAVSVKDELIANGIAASRISVIPFGETQAEETLDRKKNAEYRRVEIRFQL